MNNQLGKQHLVIGVFVGALLIGLLPSAVHAATCPEGKVLAVGESSFPQGSMGIFINFNSDLPSPQVAAACQNHTLAIGSWTNSGAISGIPDCVYLNFFRPGGPNTVLEDQQHVSQFGVQLKKCEDGVPVPASASFNISWEVITTK